MRTRVALLLNSCMCALKQSEWNEAIGLAEQTLDLEPTNVKALFRKAQAHSEREEWNEAVESLVAATEAGGDDAAIRRLLAKAQKEKSKQVSKSKKMYGKMLG